MKKLLLLISLILWAGNIAFAQPTIKVCNSKDSLKTLKQISQYLEYLGISEKVYLHVKFSVYMADDFDGVTYVKEAIKEGKIINVFMVRVDARLNQKKQSLVLAHEMIHVKQYVKGELKVIDEKNVLWRGKKHYGNKFNSRKTPWESEAYHYDRQLVNEIEEKYSVPQLPVASRSNL